MKGDLGPDAKKMVDQRSQLDSLLQMNGFSQVFEIIGQIIDSNFWRKHMYCYFQITF